MPIYTKTGDEGFTSAIGVKRLRKSDPLLRVLGDLDEFISFLGLLLCEPDLDPESVEPLRKIQKNLFSLSSELAFVYIRDARETTFPPEETLELESLIDRLESNLEPLREFIVPGGSRIGSMLHLARTICRRCERELAELIETIPPETIPVPITGYINRLSDLLFMMARYETGKNKF